MSYMTLTYRRSQSRWEKYSLKEKKIFDDYWKILFKELEKKAPIIKDQNVLLKGVMKEIEKAQEKVKEKLEKGDTSEILNSYNQLTELQKKLEKISYYLYFLQICRMEVTQGILSENPKSIKNHHKSCFVMPK